MTGRRGAGIDGQPRLPYNSQRYEEGGRYELGGRHLVKMP